jgi:hypothetical protein
LGPIEKLLKEETRLTQRKDYQDIQRNTNRLLHLINDFVRSVRLKNAVKLMFRMRQS